MKKLLFFILVLVVSFGLKADDNIPFIHTPWNSDLFQDTWQESFIIEAGSFWNRLGKDIGSWFGKQIQQDINRHQEHLLERIKENNIVDYTVIYEDYLHPMQYYKELEKEIKSPDDLTTIIDHLKKQKDSLEKDNKTMNHKFVEYIEDLEHIRDYWQQEEDKTQLTEQTAITIIMGVLVILVRIAAILGGVPA